MAQRLLNVDEVAAAVDLPVVVVRRYAQIGIIAPQQGYSEHDLSELRRVRRLMDDLGLDLAAIEIVLRMRQRILALEQELRSLHATRREQPGGEQQIAWTEATWDDASL